MTIGPSSILWRLVAFGVAFVLWRLGRLRARRRYARARRWIPQPAVRQPVSAVPPAPREALPLEDPLARIGPLVTVPFDLEKTR